MTNAPTDTTTKAGLGDIAEIFYAPSAVFARRADGKFFMPYLALVVLAIVIVLATKGLIQPVIEGEVARGMAKTAAKNPQMTADQLASAASIGKTIGQFALIGSFILAPFFIGLFVWIGGKIAKVQSVGTVALMVATFSFFPRLLGSIAGAVLAAMVPEGAPVSLASISVGPAHFIDPATAPVLFAVALRFDLFLLWGVVLIAIGVRVAGKATNQQARTTAIIAWAIPSILGIGSALLRGG